MTVLNAFKGISGEYEVQRILGAFGTIVYVVTAPALVWAGKVTASLDSFCVTYPVGLGICIGACAGSIALKDRSVAKARAVERSGEKS